MYPVLFQLGRFTIDTYTVAAGLAFLVAALFAKRQLTKRGMLEQQIAAMVLWAFVGTLLGGRLLYVIVNAWYFVDKPWQALYLWRGGLVSYGGIIGLLAGVALFARKKHLPLGPLLDVGAVATAVAVGIGRLGCLGAGCDYGIAATAQPWAVTYGDPASAVPPSLFGVPLHPVQLYLAAANFVVFALGLFLLRRAGRPGSVFATVAMAYASLRFWLEFYRGDLDRGFVFSGALSTAQLIGLFWFGLGVAALVTAGNGFWVRGKFPNVS